MPKRFRMPFRNLDAEAWKRLALVALLAFYLVQAANILFGRELFHPVGLDFFGFWSAGRAATLSNYSQVYDLGLLKDIQVQQLDRLDLSTQDYAPFPAPLFSIFLVPFQLFSFLEVRLSFWIWSLINLVILVIYLGFFISRISGRKAPHSLPKRILVFLLLSYPVFHNFYWGQIDVFLLICCGECIRNALLKRPLISGLWLGGLLIKPQILFLVIPALFLLKNGRMILGFVITSLCVLASSLALSGFQGLLAMLKLWFSYLPGIDTNAPAIMANWRMLGLHLSALLSPWFGWAVAISGMVASLVIWYLLWRRKPAFGSAHWITMLGGIFSITCAFIWHSHVHMMMVIIPFLVFASLHGMIPRRVYELWVFAIPVATILVLVAAALSQAGILPFRIVGGLFFGATGLALNVWIALVFLRRVNRADQPPPEEMSPPVASSGQ
jgi:hypothetical protein